ncbi:hypothetical protein TruAng_008703 [Truncatella angustata]|nr:hypothetical protein TruAng_008703 [Truncatella angustata]
MAASSQPTLRSLAAKISELSEALNGYLDEEKVPAASFAADSPTRYPNLPPNIFMVRQELLDNLNDLWYLAQGPSESVFNYVHSAIPNAAALNVLNSFDFWSAVPLSGSASYEEVAAKVALPRDVVYRILQHAITMRLFAETRDGSGASRIEHTSRSAALAQASGLRALVSSILGDSGAPMMVLNEALRRFSSGQPGLSQKMDETSFALLYGRSQLGDFKNSWELLENDGEGDKQGWRQRNFVEFMRYLNDLFHLENVVLDSYEWPSEGQISVVDVGGSAGSDAIRLARQFSGMSVTVQDLKHAGPAFEAALPQDLSDRVRFVEHSFFNVQPVTADIYLLKMILHDWPDAECAQILRNLIPAMKPGAKVILIEYIGGAGEENSEATEAIPLSSKQYGTATDLRLMAMFNGKERPISAWKSIFDIADPRFNVRATKVAPSGFFGIVEASWDDK